MTCSKSYGRLLQASCLGLLGALAIAGCGSSDNGTKPDTGVIDGGPTSVAAFTISSASADFGTVAVGAASAPRTFVITNVGKTASSAVTVTFTGAGFAGTGCTGALAPNATCTETVTFTPTAAGAATGTMVVTAGTATVSATLSGTGTKGALTFSPSTVELPNVAVGATKAGQVVLSNSGAGAATGLLVGVSGTDFAIDATTTTCKTSLEAGATCVVGYILAPKTAGDKTGQISATATGSSAVAIVTAKAPAPAALTISPTTAPLTSSVGVDSTAFNLTVLNSGGTATGNITAAITGTDKDSFRTTTSTCTSLEPRAYCTIAVVFNAATKGAKTAKLTVTDSVVSASADLTGTTQDPGLTITGGPDLGTVEIGKTGNAVTFTVANSGNVNSGALAVSTGGNEFVITADKCTGKDLKAAETCTVSVALAPATAGAKAALLTVKGTTSTNLTMTGTATPISVAVLTIAPDTWDFGTVPTNMNSTAKTFTVTNEGLATTGNLTVAATGAAAASFVTTSTCNAPLAVKATCTVTVTFKPAAATPLAATLSVSDGAVSAAAALSGTGVAPSPIAFYNGSNLENIIPADGCSQVLVTPAGGLFASSITQRYLDWSCNSTNPTRGFKSVVVGDPSATASSVVFTLKATATDGFTETGALTPAISGAAATDFTVGVNTCQTSLLGGQTCTIEVKFAPTATGVRDATLTVTSAKGGNAVVRLYAYGQALVDLLPVGVDGSIRKGATTVSGIVTLPTATPAYNGLDFGDQAFGAAGTTLTFRARKNGSGIASGVNPVAVALTSNGTGLDDFRIVTNGCTGGAVTGAAPYICDFTVQFFPQSSKGTKTADVSLTGTNGGQPKATVTGNATGPLSWAPVNAQSTGFGDVVVGSSSSNLTLTLTNGGGVSLGPVTLAIDSTEVAYAEDNCSGQTLTTSARTCTVKLILIPTAVGAKTGKITATAGTETAEYSLTGNGITAPSITVSPNSSTAPVAFANTANTAKSAFVVFTVANPASVATREITYVTTGQFEKVDTDLGTCGVSGTTRLDPGASCNIKVRFAPVDAAIGLRTGTLTVSAVAGQPSIVVNLQGLATSQIVVTPTSNAFAPVAIGQTSAPVTFTVTNQGGSAASVSMAKTFTNGGFALSAGTCNPAAASTIAAGGSCTFLASITGAVTTSTPAVGDPPTVAANQYPAQIAGRVTLTAGSSTQSLTLTGSVTTLANIQPFQFSGTGASATSVLLGTAVSQGSAATPSVTVMYQNKGKSPASSITAQWCTGNSYSAATCAATDVEFSIVSELSTCLSVSQLAPDATCTMTVRQLPQAATVTPKYLNLKYNNGADTTDLVAFRFLGAGRTSTTPYLSPANYTFAGATASGATSTATTLTFNNPSSGSVTPTAVAVVGQFAITGGTCALNTPVPVAGSCTLIVVFTPTAGGSDGSAGTVGRVGSLTMTASAVDYSVGLAATMKRPAYLTITQPGPFMQRTIAGPSTFAYNDFGTAVVGRTTPALSFTVTNVGDSDTLALTADVQGTAASSFLASSGCSGALAAHASCTLTVTATPAAAGWVGSSDTVLHVTDAQATPVEVYSLALNAMGNTKAQLARSPSVKNFPAQAVKSASCYEAVALTNGASTLYAATDPLVVGVSSTDYEVIVSTPSDTATCTYTPANQPCAAFVKDNVNNTTNTGLPGGSSCDVWVRFVPQTLPSPATINGSLTVAGGSDAGTVTVSMTGTAKSALSASAATLTSVGSITFTNALGAPTTGILSTTLATPSNIVITANSCVGKTLSGVAGTNTCSITIAKAAAGAATGTLTVAGTPGNSAAVTINIP